MLFSVVIPTFNRAGLLAKTLASVWQQTFKDFEIIVVDDGSTDKTLDYLRSLDGLVHFFTQTNKGPGAARNLGAKHARGEYVAFLDSDDIWFPWTLETFAKLILEHDSPAVLSARLIEFQDEKELSNVHDKERVAEYFADYFASYGMGYFVGAGMAVLRRDVLMQHGGFVEMRLNAEDHDLILRLGATRGFVQVLAPVTLGWRRHAASETADILQSYAGNLQLIKQERNGAYPGGKARMMERREILTRHVRPIALGCLREDAIHESWMLYRAVFRWHVWQRRWKFLTMFPILSLVRLFRRLR